EPQQAAPVERGQELEVELEETHLHAETDAIARLDGYVITVVGGAEHVGEKVAIVIDDVGRTSAHAVLAEADGDRPRSEKPKKKTRRGTRGGRGRKKKPAVTAPTETAAVEEPAGAEKDEPQAAAGEA